MKTKQTFLPTFIMVVFISLFYCTGVLAQSNNSTTLPDTNHLSSPAAEQQLINNQADQKNGMKVISNGQEALNNGQSPIQGVLIQDSKKIETQQNTNQPAIKKDSLTKTQHPPQFKSLKK